MRGDDSLLQGRILMPDFQNTQGIIFVVDSNDRERITEAREERACGPVRRGTLLTRQSSEC